MPGFFEAFDSSKPVVKKHTVTIQGNEVEVSLGKKLEIMRAGEDKYILKGNEIVVKPMSKNKRQFPTLKKDKMGCHFHKGDPFWVERIAEEGYTWKTESE